MRGVTLVVLRTLSIPAKRSSEQLTSSSATTLVSTAFAEITLPVLIHLLGVAEGANWRAL